MEIGEKVFLTTNSDLEPINTKLDTVISDTTTLKSTTSTISSTTQDANSTTNNLHTKITETNNSLDSIVTEESLTSTISIIDDILAKLDNLPTAESWYASDIMLGDETVLINNKELLTEPLSLIYDSNERYLNSLYVIGEIIPPISGIYNIQIVPKSSPSTKNTIQFIIVPKSMLLYAYIANNSIENLLDPAVGIIYLKKFNLESFGTTGYDTGGSYIMHMLGASHLDNNESEEYNMFCIKNEPVYILVSNYEDANNITLSSLILNVKYYPWKR